MPVRLFHRTRRLCSPACMHVEFVVCDTPQQENYVDCGVFVIALTQLLHKRLLAMKDNVDEAMEIDRKALTQQEVTQLRLSIRRTIEEMAAKRQ